MTLNPLGLAVQRYGANLEVVPLPHHAFVGTAFLQSVPLAIVKSLSGYDQITDSGKPSVGGELGYRLYSGKRGADGLFAGASFVMMPLAYPRIAADFRSAELVHYTAPGGALDIGAQAVTSSGFTVGGGIGAMYLGYTLPSDPRRIPLPIEPHLLPRLLLAAGWSF